MPTTRRSFQPRLRTLTRLPLAGPLLGGLAWLLLMPGQASAQSDTWDVGLTEALIARNKQEHAERQTLRDNQLRSTLQTEAWRSRQHAFRRLVAETDRRLTSVFILLGDAVLVYEALTCCREMADLQQESLELVLRHPQALLAAYRQQERIVADAADLLRFGHLVVAGHGELGRMHTAARQAVYRELRDKLQALRLRCRLLRDSLRGFDLAETLRRQPALAFLARDRALVQDILQSFR